MANLVPSVVYTVMSPGLFLADLGYLNLSVDTLLKFSLKPVISQV